MTDTNDVQMVDAPESDDKNDAVKEPNVGTNLDPAYSQALLTTLLGLCRERSCWHAAFPKVSLNSFSHRIAANK